MTNSNPAKPKSEDPHTGGLMTRTVFVFLSVAVAVCIFLAWKVAPLVDPESLQDWAQFGDAMAAGGLILTGLGLFVTALALVLQRVEVRAQVRELELSREAQTRLAAAQETELTARVIETHAMAARELRRGIQQALADANDAEAKEHELNQLVKQANPENTLISMGFGRREFWKGRLPKVRTVVRDWASVLSFVEQKLNLYLIQVHKDGEAARAEIFNPKEFGFCVRTLDQAQEVLGSLLDESRDPGIDLPEFELSEPEEDNVPTGATEPQPTAEAQKGMSPAPRGPTAGHTNEPPGAVEPENPTSQVRDEKT